MFTKRLDRRRYGWQRKKKRRVPLALSLALLLIGVPVGLELLARAIASLTGTSPSDSSSAILQAYQLKFLSPDGQPYPTLPSPGQLLARRNPLMGYQLPQQRSPFLTINEQGFRENDAIPVQKNSREVRIFVLGGSTAFGQLSSNDQTLFSNQLESLLNGQVADQTARPGKFQPAILPYTAEDVDKVLARPPRIPDRQYQVINAAVPGYASGNELAMLIHEVADHNPDMIVVLDGYGDLMLPSSYPGADVPGLDAILEGKPERSRPNLTQQLGNWLQQLAMVQLARHYIWPSQPKVDTLTNTLNVMTAQPGLALDQALATDAKELDRRINRYREHLSQMARWSAAAKKPLFVALQPEITGRKTAKLSPAEAAMLQQLGKPYVERMQQGQKRLAAIAKDAIKPAGNGVVLDLYRLYETYDGQAFQSPTSLTDEANAVLAKTLYQAIATKLAVQPQPFEAGLSRP